MSAITSNSHVTTWTRSERRAVGAEEDRAHLGKILARHPRGLIYAKTVRMLAIRHDIHKSTAMHYVRAHCDQLRLPTTQINRVFKMKDWRPGRDHWWDSDYDRLDCAVIECIAAAQQAGLAEDE